MIDTTELRAYFLAFVRLTIYTLGWLVVAALSLVALTDIVP